MGTLAAGVAHEINNPLTYIMANIGFVTERLNKLKRSLTPSPPGGSAGPLAVLAEQLEELVTALGEAQEGALRVRKIVRDLKIFAWSDQERYGAVDVRAAIEAAATMTAADITARARLVKELHPVPPVMASESRLGQVFLNLITNAVQAIKEGHPAENEIRISTGTDAMGRVVVVVADTGAGIPPEVMRRIFDPFFTTKPLGIGTGLGLYICHGIVRALGGELTVESEPGRGSRFRVALPAVLPP
jgi:signal transduction histidine kinase